MPALGCSWTIASLQRCRSPHAALFTFPGSSDVVQVQRSELRHDNTGRTADRGATAASAFVAAAATRGRLLPRAALQAGTQITQRLCFETLAACGLSMAVFCLSPRLACLFSGCRPADLLPRWGVHAHFHVRGFSFKSPGFTRLPLLSSHAGVLGKEATRAAGGRQHFHPVILLRSVNSLARLTRAAIFKIFSLLAK